MNASALMREISDQVAGGRVVLQYQNYDTTFFVLVYLHRRDCATTAQFEMIQAKIKHPTMLEYGAWIDKVYNRVFASGNGKSVEEALTAALADTKMRIANMKPKTDETQDGKEDPSHKLNG